MSDESHLSFIDYGTSPSGKTKRFEVRSKHSDGLLALIHWYGPWRRYVVYPQPRSIFDAACLQEIACFIKREMEARRADGT